MVPQGQKRAEVIVARSKRTYEKYPARTSHLAGNRRTVSSRAPYLHYTDDSRMQACRCLRAQHHERAHPVSDHDKNLAIAITRYMDRFCLESCHQPDFYRFSERQKIEWAVGGVRAERFHYLSKDKDIVCRCNRPEHLSLRRVRSPEIQELCAGFFQLYTTEATCTREQWRAVEVVTPESMRISSMSSAASTEAVRKLSTPRRDSFEYDSPSMIELLRDRENRPPSSRQRMSRPLSYSDAHHSEEASKPGEDMRCLSSGPNGETDIPRNVWRVTRPSVYLGQHDTGSLVSTPLGSSATPVLRNVDIDPGLQDNRSLALDPVPEALKEKSPTRVWYGYANSPSSSWLGSPRKHLGHPLGACSPSHNVGSYNIEPDVAGLEVSFSETLRPSTPDSVVAPAMQSTGRIVQVTELPSLGMTAELDATPSHSPFLPHHSTTLRELEGAKYECIARLTGEKPSVKPTLPLTRTRSRRLTSLIEQPLRDANLPNQEDFFFKWVEVCPRANPAPVGDCPLCQNSYHAPSKRAIRLTCGHFVHQECLISNFRSLDYELGNCAVCGMALCERTLHDQIFTDREAIFGQMCTNLTTEERIEFASRSESLVCWSEEEVAAAQLRLLKDYVDSHADEVYRQWWHTRLEPDWYNAVVLPVVQLFEGWNFSTRKRTYFANRDAFYKLVVWAELVRLMNTTRERVKRTQGKGAPFPQLNELHRKFMLAKDRYETEKWSWPTNRSGLLECEKVAQDAFSTAVSTHLGSRSEIA